LFEALHLLGAALRHLGQLEDAPALLTRAKELHERLELKEESSAVVLENLAAVLQATDREEEAEAFYRKAFDIFSRFGSPNAAGVLSVLSSLSSLNPAERLTLAIRAVQIAESKPHPPNILHSVYNNASVQLRAQERLQEAHTFSLRALKCNMGEDRAIYPVFYNLAVEAMELSDRALRGRMTYEDVRKQIEYLQTAQEMAQRFDDLTAEVFGVELKHEARIRAKILLLISLTKKNLTNTRTRRTTRNKHSELRSDEDRTGTTIRTTETTTRTDRTTETTTRTDRTTRTDQIRTDRTRTNRNKTANTLQNSEIASGVKNASTHTHKAATATRTTHRTQPNQRNDCVIVANSQDISNVTVQTQKQS
jgi:tetratricopeptide (TPR) repeat protein